MNPSLQCQNCGFSHIRNRCPAYGKLCSFCNKMNHFNSVCKTRLAQTRQREHTNQISNPTQPNIQYPETTETVNTLYDEFVFKVEIKVQCYPGYRRNPKWLSH